MNKPLAPEFHTTVTKREEDPKSDSPRTNVVDPISKEELGGCMDLLRSLNKKMKKYQVNDRNLSDKLETIVQSTIAVNDMASESQNAYQAASKKDLLRKDL